MTLAYILKLGFLARYTNVKVLNIDSSIFKLFKIVLASFQVEDKFGKA